MEASKGKGVKKLLLIKKKHGQRRSKYNFNKSGKPHDNVYGAPKNAKPKEQKKKEWVCITESSLRATCIS